MKLSIFSQKEFGIFGNTSNPKKLVFEESILKKCKFIFLVFFLFYSCEKETILVPAEEPDLTNPNEVQPGEFTITVENITNRDLYLKWGPVKNADSYDIIVNNTTTIYDIKKETYLPYYYYYLTNLTPNTEYELTVRARSKDMKASFAHTSVKTMKNFVEDVIWIDFDKYEYEHTSCYYSTNTADGGIIMVFRVFHFGEEQTLLVKVNREYQIEWIKLAKSGHPSENICIISCKDGYLFMHNTPASAWNLWNSVITKIDKNGEISWNTEISTNNQDSFRSVTELSDGSFFVIGMSNNRTCMVKLSFSGNLIFKTHGN